jgi:hypothetical protein
MAGHKERDFLKSNPQFLRPTAEENKKKAFQ